MVVSTKNQELSIKNVVFSKLKERLDVCVCVFWLGFHLQDTRNEENKGIFKRGDQGS